jgi:sugar phosphate permease
MTSLGCLSLVSSWESLSLDSFLYVNLLLSTSFSLTSVLPLQGVNYYITLWYCRRECAFRAAIFFSAATVAGAFGGLLARGINEMNGVGGKPGWAWIFILEGLITIVIAVIAFWAVSDNPKTASFLTADETREVQARLSHDNDDLAQHYDTKFMWHAFMDWKIWIQCM